MMSFFIIFGCEEGMLVNGYTSSAPIMSVTDLNPYRFR